MGRYLIFAPESDIYKFKGHEDEVFDENVLDLVTGGQFRAKIMVSQVPQEGYEELKVQIRGDFLPGAWFIKIVEEEEEDEEKVTIFKTTKLSERRGYMLRSMMEEEKSKRKLDIMGKELEEREKMKQDIVKKIRKE